MRPLPAVLLDLHEDLATGKLTLRRGRVSKTVDLVNGNPVSSTSTPRDETLGHFLVNGGVITEEQHRRAVARAAQSGGKLGEALVALQVLSVEQLIEQLGRQARHKIIQALRWPQGAWRFDDTDAIEGIQLRMVEVVLTGLRDTAVEDLDRLARLDGMTFSLTSRGRRLRHELKKLYGERTLTLLEEGSPVDELERDFSDRARARIALDAMMMCDAIEATTVSKGMGAWPGAVPNLLSVAAPSRRARPPTVPKALGTPLFDILFEDLSTTGDGYDGAAPIELDERFDDSGLVSSAELVEAHQTHDASAHTRQTLNAEHQRVQGADHYAVLIIGRRATGQEIEAAHQIRASLLAHASDALTEPRDRAKIDEVRAAYEVARVMLLDDRKRTAYDRELAGGELVQVAPSIDTELSFRIAEDLMAKEQWAQAIGHIRKVIAQSPGEADYHAALGWAEWMAGEQKPAAADVARAHLNKALEVNPDHAAAHEYKGRIDAALDDDDAESLFHLERAVDLDPARVEAVATIERLLFARGELRRYERVLKRLLFRLRGKGTPAEAKAWARLAKLYFEHLDDPVAAAAAVGNATRIAPRDSDAQALLTRIATRSTTAEPIRAGWREALADPRSGAALVQSTVASGHIDAAFLAASAMVAMGTGDATMSALYEKHRIRGVALPPHSLTREHWSILRHKDDSLELGGLFELVAPAVHAIAPMSLADSELDSSMLIGDGDLASSFLRLRARVANLLGVSPAPVYAKTELGNQIHVIACEPPVLVAGDEALTSGEKPELVFKLVRAMTFLWPGRAVGASRPGRALKAVVMAMFRDASGTDLGADDPNAAAANAAIEQLAPDARVQARAAALRLLSRGTGLNLSAWAKSLSRTADRAGMLLCRDVPAAFAGARDIAELDRDLAEFAYSIAHVRLRQQLGLS